MWSTDLVNRYLRLWKSLGEGAGRSGVIEMYMGDDDPIDRLDAEGFETIEDVVDDGLRSGFKKSDLFSAYDKARGYPRVAVHSGVYRGVLLAPTCWHRTPNPWHSPNR